MKIKELIERIHDGRTTAEDAVAVALLMGRLAHYEAALMDIVDRGDAGAAMKTCQALADVGSMPVAGEHA